MMFLHSFEDELIKTAKYPISQLLTSRRFAGGMGTLEGSAAAGLSPMIPIVGGVRAGQQAIARYVGAKGMAGRLRRGGKGLMKGEKKRLMEATGMNEKQLERAISTLTREGGGKGTHRISRALSTKYNPLNIPGRIIGSRGFTGRALKGKGLTKSERKILEDLTEAHKKGKRKRLAIGGLGGGALAAGAAAKD